MSRPQTCRSVADLLQISVNELLLLVQSHALPWLVLKGKKDVVQKIDDARQETDAKGRHVLLDTANNGAILALLLAQDAPDIEAFVMSRLREYPSSETWKLKNLMKAEAVAIVLELLKAAGDASEDRKPRVGLCLCST